MTRSMHRQFAGAFARGFARQFGRAFGFALLAASLLLPGACVRHDADEVELELAEAPAAARAAAEAAVPGIVLSRVVAETEDGVLVHEFTGVADGVEYEIEVAADGRVLEIERADEDDSDEDEDEESDEDDAE